MILQIFHDRRSLTDVAALKAALEDCYSAFGLQVQERGFLYIPVPGSEANAALLLKYLDKASGKVRALWLVDRDLHYRNRPRFRLFSGACGYSLRRPGQGGAGKGRCA